MVIVIVVIIDNIIIVKVFDINFNSFVIKIINYWN